jgi:hypothetical protein
MDLDVESSKEDVFQQLKACLVTEGRKGLEFRLGEGFKQALEDAWVSSPRSPPYTS